MNDSGDAYGRLQRLYSDMSDSKLLEMAESIDDLTDHAQRALKEEVSKRGLETQRHPQVSIAAGGNQDGLVVVHEAGTTEDAQRIAEILESAGIRTLITTQRIEYVDGTADEKPVVKVVYLERDRARSLISEVLPHADEREIESQYAVCPSCQSPDIVFEGLEPQSESEADSKYNWTCDACGHRWIDDGIQQLSGAQGD